MTKKELFNALESAQMELYKVYAFAVANGMDELARQMSMADTMILDAYIEIEKEKE